MQDYLGKYPTWKCCWVIQMKQKRTKGTRLSYPQLCPGINIEETLYEMFGLKNKNFLRRFGSSYIFSGPSEKIHEVHLHITQEGMKAVLP